METEQQRSLVTQTVIDPSRIPSALTTPSAPITPPAIPDYRLITHIGSGAFGDVWLAEESLMPGVFRAVKVLRSRPAGSSSPAEKSSTAIDLELEGLRLYETRAHGHPHLVQVLRVGCTDAALVSAAPGNAGGCVYYVMEIADHAGGAQPFTPIDYRPLTLKTLLHYGGRLPASRAIELQCQLLDGLEHLHRNGLQHRDVKPGNLVFVRGALKLADLGLMSRDDVRQSCGTRAYLPPDTNEPDDLYAAGVVLYEMLTGLAADRFPEWPADLDPTADPRLTELRALFSRACDRDRRRRFTDAASFRLALASLAQPPNTPIKVSRRQMLLVPAAGLGGLAVGSAATLAASASDDPNQAAGAPNSGDVERLRCHGKPPFDGSRNPFPNENGTFSFEWVQPAARMLEWQGIQRTAFFDLQVRWDGSILALAGGFRIRMQTNPCPRDINSISHAGTGEVLQIFLVLGSAGLSDRLVEK